MFSGQISIMFVALYVNKDVFEMNLKVFKYL